MHQSIPVAPSTPPGYCGAFARLVSPGGGAFANFGLPRGRAFANPGATTQRILLGKKADWLICQGQKKLKRFVKACSWFYTCISSLLIEPELHSEIGRYRRESTFFGYWIKFLLRLFEKHPFIFIKLFIKHITLQRSIAFNVNSFTSIPKL